MTECSDDDAGGRLMVEIIHLRGHVHTSLAGKSRLGQTRLTNRSFPMLFLYISHYTKIAWEVAGCGGLGLDGVGGCRCCRPLYSRQHSPLHTTLHQPPTLYHGPHSKNTLITSLYKPTPAIISFLAHSFQEYHLRHSHLLVFISEYGLLEASNRL